MAIGRCALPNVCICLVLQAFVFQASALKLQNNADEQDHIPPHQNLAVCISGGIRQGDECAESHVRSIIEASRNNFNNVKIFFATWTDRQCIGDPPPVTESFIRGMYPNQSMDIWIGDARGYPLYEAIDYRIPSEKEQSEHWPYPWSSDMWQKCRNMATLWEKCMDMIPDTYDVIVRIRPDTCFPDSYRLILSPEAVKIVRPADTNASFIAHLEEGKVFMPKNYHHSTDTPNIPDDRMGFGLAKPMKQVFGTLVQRADKHDFDLTDEQYVQKWGTPEWSGAANAALNPHGFWVREPYPEILVAHHLLNNNINCTFTEPADLGLWNIGNRGVHCGAGYQTRNSNTYGYDYN